MGARRRLAAGPPRTPTWCLHPTGPSKLHRPTRTRTHPQSIPRRRRLKVVPVPPPDPKVSVRLTPRLDFIATLKPSYESNARSRFLTPSPYTLLREARRAAAVAKIAAKAAAGPRVRPRRAASSRLSSAAPELDPHPHPHPPATLRPRGVPRGVPLERSVSSTTLKRDLLAVPGPKAMKRTRSQSPLAGIPVNGASEAFGAPGATTAGPARTPLRATFSDSITLQVPTLPGRKRQPQRTSPPSRASTPGAPGENVSEKENTPDAPVVPAPLVMKSYSNGMDKSQPRPVLIQRTVSAEGVSRVRREVQVPLHLRDYEMRAAAQQAVRASQ